MTATLFTGVVLPERNLEQRFDVLVEHGAELRLELGDQAILDCIPMPA